MQSVQQAPMPATMIAYDVGAQNNQVSFLHIANQSKYAMSYSLDMLNI